MIKITWTGHKDPFSNFFAVCDNVSAWQLACLLKNLVRAGDDVANVKAWDLSGNELPLDKGYKEFSIRREVSSD